MLKIQPYTYHCHTDFSDGYDELAVMVHHAKEIGFSELGISDHLIVHKNMYQSPSWPDLQQKRASYIYNNDFKSILDKYRRHCEEIRRLSRQENFRLLVGFEVDYFPYDGWEEELKWFVAQLDTDYLHTGNHFFCTENWEQVINMTHSSRICTDKLQNKEYYIRHFQTMEKAVNSRMFKFLAHIDYIRRFADDSYSVDTFRNEKNAVLDALKNTGTAMEISTKGLRRVGDLYPDFSIIQAAGVRDLTVVISDDAHKIEELGENFDKAEEAIKKAGITKRLKI